MMPLPYATDGPACFIPPRIALLIEQYGRLDDFRLAVRGRDAELDAVLYALHTTAMRYDPTTSADGRPDSSDPGDSSSSTLMTANEVAEREGCTDHAVRAARREGRLVGIRLGDRWLFEPRAVAAWRATRRSTT